MAERSFTAKHVPSLPCLNEFVECVENPIRGRINRRQTEKDIGGVLNLARGHSQPLVLLAVPRHSNILPRGVISVASLETRTVVGHDSEALCDGKQSL